MICASRQVGKALQPPLTPIPVAGLFDRVGVDVLKFPKSELGNQYAIVFVGYLTKWPEVYPASGQSALTFSNLFVREVVFRHGVPAQLLSDRGKAFLSLLLREVCEVLGVKKLNTTAYHPQTDGLVEQFNRTLTNMLAKQVERNGSDWDIQLPYVLFAYRSCIQESTQESPFFLVHGRDPRLPSVLDLEMPLKRSELSFIHTKESWYQSSWKHGIPLTRMSRKHRRHKNELMIGSLRRQVLRLVKGVCVHTKGEVNQGL